MAFLYLVLILEVIKDLSLWTVPAWYHVVSSAFFHGHAVPCPFSLLFISSYGYLCEILPCKLFVRKSPEAPCPHR